MINEGKYPDDDDYWIHPPVFFCDSRPLVEINDWLVKPSWTSKNTYLAILIHRVTGDCRVGFHNDAPSSEAFVECVINSIPPFPPDIPRLPS